MGGNQKRADINITKMEFEAAFELLVKPMDKILWAIQKMKILKEGKGPMGMKNLFD